MDLAISVYLISLLPNLHGLQLAITILGGTICLGLTAAIANHTFDTNEYSWNLNKDGTLKESVAQSRAKMKTIAKRVFAVLCITSLLLLFIPSEKTAYMMVGAYSAQRVAENPKVQEMSGKVLKIVESKLDKYVEEAEKKVADEIDKKTK